MDVRLVIKQRLEKLGLEQRDLAAAAQVTESYISQLLTRKKAPPAVDRTDLYERMNWFLRLPKGQLCAMVEAQRREELKKKLADPPAALFREVRELVIRKCKVEKQMLVRDVFEKQAFGELERLVTQKLLDVTKKIAKDELKNENWLRAVAKLRGRSYEELRVVILEFLDTEMFNLSPDHCSAFLNPIIDCWDIDLRTFDMDIVLNRRLASTQSMKFRFLEVGPDRIREEPGFHEFLGNARMSRDASEAEIVFLKGLKFEDKKPNALYYYRELQNLRDPLHFRDTGAAPADRLRDSNKADKQMQFDSRKKAIRRWARNKADSPKKDNRGPRSR